MTVIFTYKEIGVYSLAVYAYFSFLLYKSLESAVHGIFQEKTRRSQLISIVLSFLLVSMIAGFVLIAFAATSIIQILNLLIGMLRVYLWGVGEVPHPVRDTDSSRVCHRLGFLRAVARQEDCF